MRISPKARALALTKIVVGTLFGVYLSYVAGIALLLNTPLFARLAEMSDPGKTHLAFDRAWSLVPGTIRAAAIRVLVREPDVEIDVELRRARIDLDFGALRTRRIRVTSLRVDETTVAIRKKNPPPDAERIASVREYAQAQLSEERRRLAERWTIDVERVDLRNLPWVKLEEKILRGRMEITGAFLLQPGTQAEVYPSRFTIADGNWNGEITGLRLESEMRIHRFRKSRVNGSEVLRYLDARVSTTAKASGLQFLNVTLRSLSDYGFGDGEANLAATLEVRSGKILPGSEVRADRSTIRLNGPRFDASGKGRLEWKAGKDDDSTLRAEIADAKAEVRFGRNRVEGSVRGIVADVRILGLDLTSAFTGLAGRIRVRDGAFTSTPAEGSDESPGAFRYSARARVGGEIAAIAGNYPKKGRTLARSSSFAVALDESTIVVPAFGIARGRGRITLAVHPIDFRKGSVDFPRLTVRYRGVLDGKYPLDLAWSSSRVNRLFDGKGPEGDRWRGNGRLRLGNFDGLLKFLADTDRISGLTRLGLHATEVRSAVDWEIAANEARLTVHELDSNGIWSGFGTLVSAKPSVGAPSETRGRFEAKVFGLPVGIGIADKAVEVKLLSGASRPAGTKRP